MGYKKLDQELSFADLILKDSMDKNRCLKRLNDIHGAIDWKNIESVLMSHYVIGTSSEGADAYPPLLLLNAFFYKNGFILILTLNWKAKLTIGYLSKDF